MNIYIKSLLYLGIFFLLHFGYDLTHWSFFIPFNGIDESVFQHLKIAFWSYLLTSLLEYCFMQTKAKKSLVSKELNKKSNLVNKTSFLYSRLFSSLLIPWVIVIIWYLMPALYGKIEIVIIEVVWAICVTYLSGVIAGIIEKNSEGMIFTIDFKITIILLAVISAFLYIWFTYNPPWIDLFMNPEI